MNRLALMEQATAFFDAFVAAFHTFDGDRIAQRYIAPYLARNADGSVQCFREHAEIGRYFQDIVNAYRAQGCRSCRYTDLNVVSLGSHSVLATVTWQLLRADGSVLSSWRESYTLARTESELRIFASVDHAQ